jgi:murein DD-endopeptidase MepM/ murein hydrolase activator NlpD
MNFKVLVLFLLTLSFLSPALAADNSALSSQIEAIRREREALMEEQRKLQAELEKVTEEGRNLGTAVKSLDATKKKISSDIKVTQSKIRSANLNIQVLENNVKAAENDIYNHQKAIGDAIQVLSAYDNRSLVLDLIASANFSDVWRDRSQLKKLSEDLTVEVSKLQTTKEILSKEKEQKEKVKEEALSLEKQLSGQKAVVEENQKAKEKLLAETKSKEALYQELIAENERRAKQFEEDLYRLESELKINLDRTLIPNARKGLLSWPLDKIHVTGYFGKVSGSALRIYASGSHNGVDFRASQGTPVKSIYSGVVEGTGNTDEQRGCGSYGRWILIKHGNGLSSVYAHLSSSVVKTGQTVKTGEVIGYSGGTPGVFGSGYSTGPHLHLGLFASQGVSIRQFTQSRGCQAVSVPIVDVKAYLDPLAYLPSL